MFPLKLHFCLREAGSFPLRAADPSRDSTAVAVCDFSAVASEPTTVGLASVASQYFCRTAATAKRDRRLHPPKVVDTGE